MASRPGRVVLASASPRRRALLEAAALEVIVREPAVDETWPGGELVDAAIAVAQRKLDAVVEPTELVVAADTSVVLGAERLEKPKDAADAARMLRALSGREHQVITGFCVRRGRARQAGAVTTLVSFRALSHAEIDRYVASHEPLDKAGAYGIQGQGGALVDRVQGSYTNVVGLPLAEVLAAIEALA